MKITIWTNQNAASTTIKYLRRDVTEEGKCETENRRWIWIAKEALQNLSKVLRSRIISLQTKISVLIWHVISLLLRGTECWKFSSQKIKYFYNRIVVLQKDADYSHDHVSNL